MRKLIFISLLLTCLHANADSLQNYTRIDTTPNLYVYYPNYKSIELRTNNWKAESNDSVIYCAGAAFTSTSATVCGSYCSSAKAVIQPALERNSGCFVATDSCFKFYYNEQWKDQKYDFSKELSQEDVVCGFTQEMIIFKGDSVPHTRPNDNTHQFRALCEDSLGILCIVESSKAITFGFFIECLKAYHVKSAIYLDMGGWNYSYWRDKKGDLHEYGKKHDKYTNMITFIK